jgi:hypothetical protein
LKADPLVAVVLVIAILVGFGVGFELGNTNVRTVTSVSTASTLLTTTSTLHTTSISTATVRVTTTTRSTATTPGLELIARVTPSSITSGQNISIITGAYNPLSTTSTINVTSFKNQYLGACAISEIPATYYIYAGHVTFSNLAFNTPLFLYNPSTIVTCPHSFNSTLAFQPNSDLATETRPNMTSFLVNFTSIYHGYWVRGSGGGYSFASFTPGQYSVLVTDTWGQRELDYFVVT